MSFVLSQFFNHTDERDINRQLKSYALDDRFYLKMEQHGKYGGTQSIDMNFSIDEARTIKNQLEEFITQNT